MTDYSNAPNVLITSAGRRVSLVTLFQDATRNLVGGKVFATDLNPSMSAACHISDLAFAVPRVSATEYQNVLLQICKDNSVSLVIPTIDTELELLADLRDEWKTQHQIEIVISDAVLINKCRNKRKTTELFQTLGIKSPIELAPDSNVFPRFIKPLAGSRSIDIHKVDSAEMMQERFLDSSQFIHQEWIDSSEYREFTVDAFYTVDGNLRSIVPRERIEVRDGEVSKGRTIKGQLLGLLKDRLAILPGARGVMTYQFFVKLDSSQSPLEILGIELNPRFGGGYPLTHAAGAKYVDWLIEDHYKKVTTDYFDGWTDGLTMLRYDAEIFF